MVGEEDKGTIKARYLQTCQGLGLAPLDEVCQALDSPDGTPTSTLSLHQAVSTTL